MSIPSAVHRIISTSVGRLYQKIRLPTEDIQKLADYFYPGSAKPGADEEKAPYRRRDQRSIMASQRAC